MTAAAASSYICFDCKAELVASADRVICDCGGVLDLPIVQPRTPGENWGAGPVVKYVVSDLALERADLGGEPTPLLRWSKVQDVWLKCDQLLPTGSFKDRGARSVIARAFELGVEEVVLDSSGNAGASLAAHAARVGIHCTVYIPKTTSTGKIQQIRHYGAVANLVAGPREACRQEALAHASDTGAYYASHATNPYFHDGTKSWFYEIVAKLPEVETVVLPVGSGSLLLGLLRAIDELTLTGWITSAPKIVLAQAQGYETLLPTKWAADSGRETAEHPLAEGIAISNPVRLTQLRQRISELDVSVIAVTSYEILLAQEELGRGGFFVEPTSAAAWAAWQRVHDTQPTVVALTGHGLKSAA